jgi:4-hydroxybenzoate polyprenyltransferase
MAKLGWKQILGSILVWVLFAPVILATGSKSFRLAIYDGTILGVPTFLLLVVAVLLFLMAFMWFLASATFDDAADKAEAAAGDDQ